MILPNEVTGLNPEDLISGHNGQKQILTVKRTLVVQTPTGRTQMVERICEDQYLNTYLVYSSKLSDGQVYEVADYVKPSVILKFNGFTDALLDAFRQKAFSAFAQSEREANELRANAERLAASIASATVNVGLN